VIQFKQDKLSDARKSFERLLELAPDHGPTLNNVAVISWQQKLQDRAVKFYTQALLVAPKNRQIIDNVAEALRALPRESYESPATKKLLKLFEAQDADLQKELEQQGLHRWGAAWYNDDQMARVKADQEKIAAKKKALEQDFDRLRPRVGQIEDAISMNLQRMSLLERERWRIDPLTNTMIQFPLPPAYWQSARDTDTLRADRQALLRQLATFDDRVRAIEQEAPHPPDTGKQQITESEVAPLAAPPTPPAPPATRPADQEAPAPLPKYPEPPNAHSGLLYF